MRHSCRFRDASCSRLSPLPGITFFVSRLAVPLSSRHEGNLPIPLPAKVIIGGALSKSYFGLFSTKARGIPAKSGAT